MTKLGGTKCQGNTEWKKATLIVSFFLFFSFLCRCLSKTRIDIKNISIERRRKWSLDDEWNPLDKNVLTISNILLATLLVRCREKFRSDYSVNCGKHRPGKRTRLGEIWRKTWNNIHSIVRVSISCISTLLLVKKIEKKKKKKREQRSPRNEKRRDKETEMLNDRKKWWNLSK